MFSQLCATLVLAGVTVLIGRSMHDPATIVLFATIVGSLLARWAFGQHEVLWALVNWRFLFVAAIVAAHLTMNDLRRNILLRSLFFVIFAAVTLACLFWSFSA